jgi:DNA-binding NarL/FixJ family response regulator
MRLLIVDDNGDFLAAAQAALEREGLEVVGVASTSREAIEQLRALRPDVTLVDIDLGDESGFDVARRLAAGVDTAPNLIIISSHDGDDFKDLLEASPALGFVAKSSLSGDAIRAVLATNGRAT